MSSNDPQSASYPASEQIAARVYSFLKLISQSALLGTDPLPEAKIAQSLRMPRTAVHQAIERLTQEAILNESADGFSPASLAQMKSDRVAFVINTDLFATPYAIHIDYLIGFAQIMESQGYSVQIIHRLSEESDASASLAQWAKSGIRAWSISGEFSPEARAGIRKLNLPTVMIGNATIYQQDFPAICSDNYNGITQLTRYLLQLGHEKILYYTMGIRTHHGNQQRLAAFENVMSHAGLKAPRTFVYRDPYEPGMAARVAQAIAQMKPRPSAIICGSDRDAFELISELKQSGLSVPTDIGVTGFYNTIINLISEPALTSIDINGPQIGHLAASSLLHEMQQRQIPIRIVVPTELIKRRSVLSRLGAAKSSVSDTAKKTSRINYDADEPLLKF